MKATGIVRRIDDLGRVVIPKEIRRTLRLREGPPLEIFTDREGEIILKKYPPMVELAAFAVQYAEAMAQSTGLMVCIADRDQIIAVSGGPKKEYYQKTISRALELTVYERQNICATRKEKAFITITGLKFHFGSKPFEVGQKVKLVKEPDNEYDSEAIKAELPGLGCAG